MSREWIEAFLVCAVAIPSAFEVDLIQSTAMLVVQAATLAMVASRERLPQHLVRHCRTSPDFGLAYIGLGVTVCGARMKINGDEMFEARLMFWIAVATTLGFAALLSEYPEWLRMGIEAAVVAVAREDRWWAICLGLLCFRGMQLLWLKAFPKSFTIGEAFNVMLALALYTTDWILFVSVDGYGDGREKVWIALQFGLLGVLSLPVILQKFLKEHAHLENETADVDPRRESSGSSRLGEEGAVMKVSEAAKFFVASAIWLAGVVSISATPFLDGTNPVLYVRDFTLENSENAKLLMFWIVALAVGLPVVHFITDHAGWPLIITRKLYHLLALIMFYPGFVLAPDFLALSFGIAIALFVFLELVRICRVPPFGSWMHFFLRSYTDQRDEGTTILTHIYLLLGCAIPLWIFPETESLARIGGLAILGAGDAAGAIVGSQFGRMRWPGGQKTLEGTLAAIVATLTVLLGHVNFMPTTTTAVVLLATVWTCMIEAVTKQIDNLTLPLIMATTLLL